MQPFDPRVTSRLPAAEQLVLHPLNEMELAELIEKYIEYVDENGRSVHLPSIFVKHYLQRDDGSAGLPFASTIVQLPIVLPNGEILSGRGLNRKYGIIFRVPPELDALIPRPAMVPFADQIALHLGQRSVGSSRPGTMELPRFGGEALGHSAADFSN